MFLSEGGKDSPRISYSPLPQRNDVTRTRVSRRSEPRGVRETADTSNCIGILRGLGLKLLHQSIKKKNKKNQQQKTQPQTWTFIQKKSITNS